MADNTGAPWLLPYPESTDLVRDGADDIEALATAVASGLTAANKGIGTNVVQAVKTDAFTTSSTSFTNITGLAGTITVAATSKVLIIAQVTMSVPDAGGGFTGIRITGGNTSGYVGTSTDTVAMVGRDAGILKLDRTVYTVPIVFLDSPATSSPVTYQLQMRGMGFSSLLNRTDTSTDTYTSSLTLVEVAV